MPRIMTKPERPILFRPELVQAILEGRKTQTRRPLKPQPSRVNESGSWYRMPSGGESLNCYSCPYGRPGDLLWCRETFRYVEDGNAVEFRAGQQERGGGQNMDISGWSPSIHMPKWAARIWLEITQVRVERLMRIDPTDLVREGFWTDGVFDVPDPEVSQALKRQFLDTWQRMYRGTEYNWPNNPWVWVITFKGVEP